MLYTDAIASSHNLTLYAAPAIEPVTKTEVKAASIIDFSDDDTLLDSLIAAVTGYLDGADGILGRCLVEQTWDLKVDCFPTWGIIAIPLAPLISVESITYVDTNGDTQTLAGSVYQAFGVGASQGGQVGLAFNESWPGTRDVQEAVTIRFKAGYENSGSPATSTVPEAIKRAMMLMIDDLYQHRGNVGEGLSEIPMPTAAQSLLAPYRRSWFR